MFTSYVFYDSGTNKINLNHLLTLLLRALAMEQLIDAVDLERECKFQRCDFASTRDTLTSHENRCCKRPVSCPDLNCEQVIPLREVMDHLRQKMVRNEVDANEEPYKIEYTISTSEFKRRGDASRKCMDILGWNLAH